MKHVFISYSWKDKPLARRIARRLRHVGVEVFLDEERGAELPPGHSLPLGLTDAIRSASHVLLVWTPAAAAASAPGRWLALEIDTAVEARAGGTLLVPLLFHDPSVHPVVNRQLGISFDPAYRFEPAFRRLLAAVFPAARDTPEAAALAADLVLTARENPRLRGVLHDPVAAALDRLPGPLDITPPGSDAERAYREAALPVARDSFDGWVPESVATAGLPRLGDADYHALDFALWCAARRTLLIARAPGLKPIGLGRYPGIFARVLAATGAGYDALVELLDEYPGLAPEVMAEVGFASDALDAALPAAIELFRYLFGDDRPAGSFPWGAAVGFAENFASRLTRDEKLRLLDLIEMTGNSPAPGSPVDLLMALATEPELLPGIVEKIRAWIVGGRFDRLDVVEGNEEPHLAHTFIRVLFERGCEAAAEALLRAASGRIRRLLRSPGAAERASGFRWIAQADRLPMKRRWRVCRAAEEGVYSVQFEAAPYAGEVARLVAPLCRALETTDHLPYVVVEELRQGLRRAGLDPDAS